MYRATWDNINRHILVVWQSMGVLFAALAAAFLSGKSFLAPDIASTIVVLSAGWSLAHAIDAKGWYNRNLHIIANIEREFLFARDAETIHPFFASGTRRSAMIEHLRIQFALAGAVGSLALGEHFYSRALPTLDRTAPVDPLRTLPYAAALLVVVGLWRLNRGVDTQHREFTNRAPGKARVERLRE